VPVGVDALLRDGDTVQAQRLVDDLAAGLAGTDAPAATAALRSSEALVARARGEWRQAVRLHEQAERSWRELPSPSEAAQERERRAELLLVNGDERGAPLIADVLASYEALGASWDADRVRRTARRHRVNLKSRRGRKGYGDALSPRELEVVGLVATGATNAEIAEQLSLSPRTVAHHVASAMRKRGVSSRTALAVSVVSADNA
jgi:DNA-binding CsgD family transcriptional regulator